MWTRGSDAASTTTRFFIIKLRKAGNVNTEFGYSADYWKVRAGVFYPPGEAPTVPVVVRRWMATAVTIGI